MELCTLQRALRRHFFENNWNPKHTLRVGFPSNSSPKSSITIFINSVRFSSECKNKDFSSEIVFSWCQVMEFRRGRICLNVEGKKQKQPKPNL